MEVNIYIKMRWSGNYGSGIGKAVGLIEYIDKKGEVHLRGINTVHEANTKNELELKACLSGLRPLKKKCKANLYMKSTYIESALRNGWIDIWRENEWKKKNGKPLANVRGWQLMSLMTEMHQIEVKGYNNKYEADLEEALSRKERARWQDIIDAM